MIRTILEIVNVDFDAETHTGTVSAIVDDIVQLYPQTYEAPAEYGPALATATFMLGDDETIPEDATERELFFEDLSLEWCVIDTSDYDD
jgi:hypothetical protein